MHCHNVDNPPHTPQVHSGKELPSGSEEEVEIRAASIMAVEQLKHAANKLLQQRHEQTQQQEDGDEGGERSAFQLLSIQLDWWLWAEGERMRSEHPHHKTWTIYY